MQNRSMELVEGRGNVPLTDDQEPAHQHSLNTKADTDRHLQARLVHQLGAVPASWPGNSWLSPTAVKAAH